MLQPNRPVSHDVPVLKGPQKWQSCLASSLSLWFPLNAKFSQCQPEASPTWRLIHINWSHFWFLLGVGYRRKRLSLISPVPSSELELKSTDPHVASLTSCWADHHQGSLLRGDASLTFLSSLKREELPINQHWIDNVGDYSRSRTHLSTLSRPHHPPIKHQRVCLYTGQHLWLIILFTHLLVEPRRVQQPTAVHDPTTCSVRHGTTALAKPFRGLGGSG